MSEMPPPPCACLPTHDPGDLADTATHAAITAAVAAGQLCLDPVRARGVRSVFSLISHSAGGDGAPARRRAAMISTLAQCAVEEDPSCARMLLAFERWILHPGPATAGELTDQAAAYSAAMDAPLQTRALTVGVCLDAAVDEVRSRGAWGAGPEAMAVIGAAADLVPLVWIAQRCGVTRDSLHHGLRATARQTPAWRW